MRRHRLANSICLSFLATSVTWTHEVAPTPPMGWNSWDSFGLTIDEANFKANALPVHSRR